MSRVITFSRFFPKKHPKAGEPTSFVEKIWLSLKEDFSKTLIGLDKELNNFACEEFDMIPKHHTIRAGNRWRVGDKFSPRVWSGKPYASKQIQFAPDIEIKKIWDIHITECFVVFINGRITKDDECVSKNDGLDWESFVQWFECHPNMKKEGFRGQILCWNESIEYNSPEFGRITQQLNLSNSTPLI